MKRLKSNQLVKNAFFLLMLQGVNYLLPLVTIPYLFRVLGAEKYGLVAFGYAFTQYFIIITDFGFNLYSVKFISENRDKPYLVNKHVNSVVVSKLILLFLCFSIVITITGFFERFSENRVFFLSFFGMVIGNAAFPLWFFQGIEKMKFITVINVLAKGLSVIPFFIWIRSPDHFIIVPIFYSTGYLIAGIYSLYLVYFKFQMKFYFVKASEVFEVLKCSSSYFLSRASLSLFTTSNAFFLGLVCGNVQVGYYTIAEKIYQAYNSLISPLNGVLFPHMAKTKDVFFYKNVIKKVVLVNILLVIITLLMSEFIVWLLFHTNNKETIYALQVLIFACLFTIPSILLGYPFLAAMGHPKYTNFTVVLASMFHLLGLSFLVMFGGVNIVSVAVMVLITETFLFVIRVYGVKKFLLFK